jgi:hypothetical protein
VFDFARIAAFGVMVAAYGAIVLAGGMLWWVGWKQHNETMLKVGDVTVLVGLLADAVLVTSNWLYDWSGWIEASMR